jgi:hypothetical protein
MTFIEIDWVMNDELFQFNLPGNSKKMFFSLVMRFIFQFNFDFLLSAFSHLAL